MRAIFIIICVVIFAFSAGGDLSYAQEENMQSKRYENVEWKTIVHIKYYNGKRARALEIIRDHFKKAGKKAGTPGPEQYILRSGEWDMMLIWNMKGGIEDMTWERSPDGVAWRKALNEQEGGADKAQAILDEYRSLVANSSADIAMQKK